MSSGNDQNGNEWLGKPYEEHPGVRLVRVQELANAWEPPHFTMDANKIRKLMTSIRHDGWLGAPLVADELANQLLTGSHRWSAVHDLLVVDPAWGISATIPVIGLADVFRDAGMNLAQVQHKHGLNQHCVVPRSRWPEPKYALVLLELPAPTQEKYGIDAVLPEEEDWWI